MTHRAERIVVAAQAAVAGLAGLTINASNVYAHRTLTLSEDDGELDAICVNQGEDVPMGEEGMDNTAFIDSELELEFESYAKHSEESEVRQALTSLRRQIHQALMADDTLGLSFVVGVRYAGAERPSIDPDGNAPSGRQTSRWRVHYRMNKSDPGA